MKTTRFIRLFSLAALVALLPQLFGGGAAVPWRDLAIMLAAVLLVGVWPAPLVNVMDATVGQLLAHVVQSKL